MNLNMKEKIEFITINLRHIGLDLIHFTFIVEFKSNALNQKTIRLLMPWGAVF